MLQVPHRLGEPAQADRPPVPHNNSKTEIQHMNKKRIPQDLELVAKHIRQEFDHWYETGHVSTLGGLLHTLHVVDEDMTRFDGNALIAEHWEDLRLALYYVELFGDPNEHDDDLPLTFDYRLATVKDDIECVEQLVEGLGESFMFADLPKPEGMENPKAA